jgi:hypothetical protein
MTGSTISGTVTTTVTLGSASYPSPLTVTSAGDVERGVYGPASAGILLNGGIISGAAGYNGGFGGSGSNGGTAVFLLAGNTATNSGTVAGGKGGNDVVGSGGNGGDGVDLTAGSTLTNGAGALIIGGAGGYGYHFSGGDGGAGVNLAGGTLANAGTIAGGEAGASNSQIGSVRPPGAGVTLTSGAILTNTGYIIGGAGVGYRAIGGSGVAIGSSNGAGTVVNAGIITGGNGYSARYSGGTVLRFTLFPDTGGYGASVAAQGTLINSGTITGGDGISLSAGVMLTNGGTIIGGSAVTVASGGTVINRGTFAAGVGAYIAPGGTLVNDGTLIGGVYNGIRADAVLFGGAGTLVVDDYRGAAAFGTFIGNVVGDAASDDVLVLGALGGTSPGTLSGLGTQFINFEQITVASGADWTLTGANTVASGTRLTELASATLSDTGTLVNYGNIVLDPSTLAVGALTGTGSVVIGDGSTLRVQGTVATGETLQFGGSGAYLHLYSPDSVTGTITNFDFGESIDLAGIDPASVSYAAGQLTFTGGDISLMLAQGAISATASSDGAVVTVICFCANTQILTPDGEQAVQDLAVGNLVTTHRGEAREIVWIGKGNVLATRGRRTAATPVIIRKGAFSDNVPNRDLRVTKGHAFWFDGVLIPAEFLVNHRLIEWDDHAQEVELYHVELASHDILIANGAPAESYRDDGNRWLFRNANSGWDLPPPPPCAPVLTGGPIVDTIWQRLLRRSGPRPDFSLTENPDLHLLVDGKRLDAIMRQGTAHFFTLAGQPSSIRIVSNAASQAELGLARDPRILGVAIRQVVLRQGTQFQIITSADPALTEGFYPFEPDNGLRWTDGNAALPCALFAAFRGPTELILQIGAITRYLRTSAAPHDAAA